VKLGNTWPCKRGKKGGEEKKGEKRGKRGKK